MARPSVSDDVATIVAAVTAHGRQSLRDLNYNLGWTRWRVYAAIAWGLSVGALTFERSTGSPYYGLVRVVDKAGALRDAPEPEPESVTVELDS